MFSLPGCVLPEYTSDRQYPEGGNESAAGYGNASPAGGTAGARSESIRGGAAPTGGGNSNVAGQTIGGTLGLGGVANSTTAQLFGGNGGTAQTGTLLPSDGGNTQFGGTSFGAAGTGGNTQVVDSGGTAPWSGGTFGNSGTSASAGTAQWRSGGTANAATAGAAGLGGVSNATAAGTTNGGVSDGGTTASSVAGASGSNASGTGNGGAGGPSTGGTATGGTATGGSSGSATCALGTADCDGNPSNGCEDLSSDARYCGSCSNDCTSSGPKVPVCGTNGGKMAPLCYTTVKTWGIADTSYQQGRAANYLHVVRRNIGSSPDPQLFSMGLWEAGNGVPYYLALYKADPVDGYPTSLVWLSDLQISQGTPSAHRLNEIVITPPISLEARANYWQALFIYSESGDIQSLAVVSGGPDSVTTNETRYAYSASAAPVFTTPPATLQNRLPDRDESNLEVPGIFIRVAHPFL
jgi:hypothetical protein